MSNITAKPLFHLGYVSTETRDLSSDEMVDLLVKAREANTKRDITGLLLYRDKSFYQVLEGNEAEVRSTFDIIEGDDRHTAVDILFEGEVEAREFADWKMGFMNLDGLEVDDLQGFSDFLNREDNAKGFLQNLSRGKRLALMFRSME